MNETSKFGRVTIVGASTISPLPSTDASSLFCKLPCVKGFDDPSNTGDFENG